MGGGIADMAWWQYLPGTNGLISSTGVPSRKSIPRTYTRRLAASTESMITAGGGGERRERWPVRPSHRQQVLWDSDGVECGLQRFQLSWSQGRGVIFWPEERLAHVRALSYVQEAHRERQRCRLCLSLDARNLCTISICVEYIDHPDMGKFC